MAFFSSRRQPAPAMTLEGVLGPNSQLDDAAGFPAPSPEALCVTPSGHLLFTAGMAIHALPAWGGVPALWKAFDRRVTALCCSPGGRVAAALADGRIAVLEPSGQPSAGWSAPPGLSSVVDCLFLSEDALAIVDPGYRADEAILSVAPWDVSERGQVLVIKQSGEAHAIIGGVHCPMGISRDAKGDVIVTELERARIVDGSGLVRQSGYPAYLGRIHRTAAGYVLACLARRDPLIEFLKTEQDFIAEMKAKIPARRWIAPRLSPDFSHDFPIELGATRLFGEIKPWAPSFSYGLVIELDESLMPVASAHSRANGRRHAISDATVWNGDLIAVSKASGEILNLGPAGGAA
jgi:hypothetical protein